jgi:hypothetical protein
MQQVWLALIVGLFLGWLIEWIVDWQFWRKTNHSLREENAQLRIDLAKAQVAVAAKVAPADTPTVTQLDSTAPVSNEGN